MFTDLMILIKAIFMDHEFKWLEGERKGKKEKKNKGGKCERKEKKKSKVIL